MSLYLAASRSEPSVEAWSAEIAARVHAELGREEIVDIATPPRLLEPSPPVVEKRPSPAPARRRASERPPPPAQAGAVMARETRSAEPLDLTGDTFVTGTARTYVGGTTTAAGTNTVPVLTQQIDPRAAPGARDLSRAVALDDEEWRCPWPSEAESEEINEQVAVIRAVVRPDGSLESASIVSDPGLGFGPAALACARRARFSPARDRLGRAVRAQSPPIRVRFFR